MSKAFTKEDGLDPVEPRAPGPTLPAGSKNYMTPAGAERLRKELSNLLLAPQAVQRDEELRIRYLQDRVNELAIIDPLQQTPEIVRFGATVTVRDEEGAARIFQIVGVDEANPKQGKVSWISPLAVTLLGGKVGDVVTLRTPKGEEDLEIVQLRYQEIP